MLGAVMRAGRKLGLPIEGAVNALEWQTRRPVQYWNDDPARTHAEVIAAFDGAIAALGGSYAVNVADHHLEGVQSQRLHRAART
jgi:hypothetical protein